MPLNLGCLSRVSAQLLADCCFHHSRPLGWQSRFVSEKAGLQYPGPGEWECQF